MTANESETSSSNRPDNADEERWLTYLNYDQSIQQAVRRLVALSPENVDLFRGLFLKSRDRSRVKEFEAESIRRLQGEAFVGDEELQRTLIVLTAENPRFGEELKRLVAVGGKPAQLDQAVAAIRSGKETAVKPSRAIEPSPEQPREAVVVPLHKERIAPVTAPAPRIVPAPHTAPREDTGETKRNLKWPLVIGAALLVLVAAGLIFAVPGLIGSKTTGNDRIAAAPPPAKPQPVASSTAPAPVRSATSVDIAIAAQAAQAALADKNASPSPALRSTQPDMAGGNAAQPDISSEPVAGSKYKVVRGDMLSDIALRVYGDASKFRLIQAANPSIRNSPNRILVDQVIFIPVLSR